MLFEQIHKHVESAVWQVIGMVVFIAVFVIGLVACWL